MELDFSMTASFCTTGSLCRYAVIKVTIATVHYQPVINVLLTIVTRFFNVQRVENDFPDSILVQHS